MSLIQSMFWLNEHLFHANSFSFWKTMFCGTHNSYHLYHIFIIYVQDVYYFLLIFLEFKIIYYWDPAIIKLNLFCHTIWFAKKSVGVIASFWHNFFDDRRASFRLFFQHQNFCMQLCFVDNNFLGPPISFLAIISNCYVSFANIFQRMSRNELICVHPTISLLQQINSHNSNVFGLPSASNGIYDA